ncbi:hypothetical protein CONPUDRAFT_71623 [Coniophora puteana RWD-64-598 SS2]|uniref:Uncharacterized protein n=1 Tax=Coniophora puteana (strain RWD-64-598) TaxID=741705 RepID=A0A5M3MUX0_CONPW|nr:uncharacterized protein CONPUDRAFT_71623 [Coniophora puteana RWD-64-598 SS2]EIW82972.1 hypothetical protein CONPUDRAFT_71623 [Coniophora puteana RWD-64-598 SS2]
MVGALTKAVTNGLVTVVSSHVAQLKWPGFGQLKPDNGLTLTGSVRQRVHMYPLFVHLILVNFKPDDPSALNSGPGKIIRRLNAPSASKWGHITAHLQTLIDAHKSTPELGGKDGHKATTEDVAILTSPSASGALEELPTQVEGFPLPLCTPAINSTTNSPATTTNSTSTPALQPATPTSHAHSTSTNIPSQAYAQYAAAPTPLPACPQALTTELGALPPPSVIVTDGEFQQQVMVIVAAIQKVIGQLVPYTKQRTKELMGMKKWKNKMSCAHNELNTATPFMKSLYRKFTHEDLACIIAGLDLYKTISPDGIPNTVYIRCQATLIPHLLPIFNAAVVSGFYYDPWWLFTIVVPQNSANWIMWYQKHTAPLY